VRPHNPAPFYLMWQLILTTIDSPAKRPTWSNLTMSIRNWLKALPFLALLCVIAALCPLRAADAPKGGVLVIIDSTGKEQKAKAWKFSVGTRHLTWLAPESKDKPAPEPKEKPAPDPKDKAPAVKAPVAKARSAIGPEALEFRDEHSTTFVDGIVTLVPLDRIRSIDYEDGIQTVTLKLLVAEGKEEVIKGTTKYKGINKITLDVEVDKGDMGIAEVKFMGGSAKGIRSVTFSAPKAPAAAPAGRPASLVINDKQKVTQKVEDLQALYRLADGTERLTGTVVFKKTLKVDLAKVKKLHFVPNAKSDEGDWQVTMKDGEDSTLSLLKTVPLDDNKTMVLEGFLGRVPAGYKLFPPHTVTDIVFDEEKKD
jgi:hypothetical protein